MNHRLTLVQLSKLQEQFFAWNAGGKFGISLQLAGAQLIELAERGESQLGFGNEEGGYVMPSNDNDGGTQDASYNF